MLVKDYMTRVVVTVREDQNILEAKELLKGKALHSLPVVDDIQRIRGIITVDDIGKASPSAGSTLSRYEANYLLGRLKVRDIMNRTVITVNDDDTIEYVAFLLYKHQVNALPVVDKENKLCGIIAQNDIFRILIEMTGMNMNCTRITVLAADRVGVVAEIGTLFKENDINLISIISKTQNVGEKAQIILRADLEGKGLGIIEALREAGFEVVDIMNLHGLE